MRPILTAILLLAGAARAEELPLQLHIEGDPRVELRAGDGAAVCRAGSDCAVRLPADGKLHFGGEGMPDSEDFAFTGPGEVRFRVRAGNGYRHAAGLALMGTGALSLLGGATAGLYLGTFAIVAPIGDSIGCSLSFSGRPCPRSEPPAALLTGMAVAYGVGLVTGIVGVLLARDGRTTWSSERPAAQ